MVAVSVDRRSAEEHLTSERFVARSSMPTTSAIY